MKIDFIPRLQRTYVGAGVAIAGLTGSLIAGGKRRKAEKQLENLQTPTTTNDKAVSDYYNQALNPTSSLEYQLAQKNANSGVAQGLTAFQDRRAGLAGIGGLIRQRNNTLLQAGASAASKLGSATQLKAADNERVFNINQMLPYQKKYSLLAAKAGGQAQVENAGLQNTFAGLSLFAQQGGFKALGGKTKTNNISGLAPQSTFDQGMSMQTQPYNAYQPDVYSKFSKIPI